MILLNCERGTIFGKDGPSLYLLGILHSKHLYKSTKPKQLSSDQHNTYEAIILITPTRIQRT